VDWFIVLSSCRQFRQPVSSGPGDFDEGFMHRQIIADFIRVDFHQRRAILAGVGGNGPYHKSSIKALDRRR
jgi:hypothetical protein